MTIDEAIKLLEKAYRDGTVQWTIEDEAALKLGIEALKFLKDWRMGLYLEKADLLPEETEEYIPKPLPRGTPY